MELRDSRILITGGSAGIGLATARALHEEGARLALTGRSEDRLRKVAGELGGVPLAFDMADYEAVDRGADEAIGALGGLDVLINNAGTGEFGLLEDLDPGMFERVFAVNVIGPAMLAKKAADHFRGHRGGTIVNIASTAANKGFPGGSVYAASKFALRGLTQCWQAELRKHDVRVIGVNPSEVTTAFGDPDRRERPEQRGKLRPKEIADVIVSVLKMDDRGFVPEVAVWATNPW